MPATQYSANARPSIVPTSTLRSLVHLGRTGRAAIAAHVGVPAASILVANGSGPLIKTVVACRSWGNTLGQGRK